MYTENQLIKRIKKNGDKEAANELVKRYYQEIYRFSYKQVTDKHLAMDLTQEIFIAVLKGISSYDSGKAVFRTWLYKIASNKIISYYRSRHYKQRSMEVQEENLELLLETYEPEEEMLQKIYEEQLIQKVMQIIVRFGNEWVAIIQMKLFQEKTFAEIAKELKLSENTVKTRYYTMIKMITTLLFPTEGEILYNGTNILDMGAAYRDIIGYLPQQFGYYKNNTPMQYLEYLACLKKMPKENRKERIWELLALVGLSDDAHTKMKKFSGGMIQRVGIAQAMLNDPKILILNEPTAGLDPKERVRFRNIISMLSKDRIVILSTHIVSDIESIANQVILIKDRRLYKMDTVSNICAGLDGRIYELEVPDGEYEAFEKDHQVLAARQENGKMVVRFYERGELRPEHAALCNANLEDVFLITYQ